MYKMSYFVYVQNIGIGSFVFLPFNIVSLVKFVAVSSLFVCTRANILVVIRQKVLLVLFSEYTMFWSNFHSSSDCCFFTLFSFCSQESIEPACLINDPSDTSN